MHLGNDSSLSLHYGLEIKAFDGRITGEISIIDSAARHSGNLDGTVSGNSISVKAVFASDHSYDFLFYGTRDSDIISGKLTFINPGDAGPDTLDVALVQSFNEVLSYIPVADPNEYILKTVFTTPSPTGQPVIFVHGMGGKMTEWDSILLNLDDDFKGRHNVYCYQYDWQDSLMINGRRLKEFTDAYGIAEPILVAHSMGGLVSRAYIANGGLITKLVTLGTPHLGSELANLVFLRADLDTPGPKDMKPSGQFINMLKTDPLDLANRDKYYCIAGRMGGHFSTTPPFKWIWNETYYKNVLNGIVCTGWRLLLPFGKNDGLVNESSALFENGGVNLVFPGPQLYVDHMHLVYPSLAPEVMEYILGL